MANYVLDNAAAETEQRFASLESSYDPFTIRQLEEIGVAPGWRCLEVGGGGGSIARWLAERVGPQGQVVVTDINPRWLDVDRPNIEMRRHDIVADGLESGAFDLAHERLVLQHLPGRRQALERMIGAVKPGGWVLFEDFDLGWLPLAPRCEPADAALFTKVMNAFGRILVEADVDVDLGRRLCSLLREYGLRDVRGRSACSDLDRRILGMPAAPRQHRPTARSRRQRWPHHRQRIPALLRADRGPSRSRSTRTCSCRRGGAGRRVDATTRRSVWLLGDWLTRGLPA